MKTYQDFLDADGKVDIAAIDKYAIPINRKSQVDIEALDFIRKSLAGNQLCLDHIGGMLKYANQLLSNAEKENQTYLDKAYSEIEFGSTTFIFRRMQ